MKVEDMEAKFYDDFSDVGDGRQDELSWILSKSRFDLRQNRHGPPFSNGDHPKGRNNHSNRKQSERMVLLFRPLYWVVSINMDRFRSCPRVSSGGNGNTCKLYTIQNVWGPDPR